MMKAFLKNLENQFETPMNYGEEDGIVCALKRLYSDPNTRILDIGSGYGRKMDALKRAGFLNVTGVEINAALVDLARKKGKNCVTPDQLDQGQQYDVLLMAHLIEHFQPESLAAFIDLYLQYLKKGGALIIVSPLMWNGFYRDFDHVKPYSPWGILSVFDGTNCQVQYYGKNQLQLEGEPVVFRMPYQISAYKNFVMIKKNIFEQGIQLVLNALFFLSRGWLGKPKAWMGVFRKG